MRPQNISFTYFHYLAFYAIIAFLLLPNSTYGQYGKVKEEWLPAEITDAYYQELITTFGNNKKLPKGFEKQALIALSYYPELKDTRIVFKIRKKGAAPFASRPSTWSLLFRKPAKRKYQVFISQKTKPVLTPILMKSLSFNGQIGVMGHELAHTSFYLKKKFGAMVKIALSTISPRYLDKFEYDTDQIAIAHGLGFQLISWSEQTHAFIKKETKLGSKGPFDKLFENERYMRPGTIRQKMKAFSIY